MEIKFILDLWRWLIQSKRLSYNPIKEALLNRTLQNHNKPKESWDSQMGNQNLSNLVVINHKSPNWILKPCSPYHSLIQPTIATPTHGIGQ